MSTGQLFRWRDWCYRVHVISGLVAALWLLLMSFTGILINHQEALGLLDIEIDNQYLPASYREDVPTETTRLNVILTDLHSGRFFGAQGHWLSDGIGLLLMISLSSGAASYGLKRRLAKQGNHRKQPDGRLGPNGKSPGGTFDSQEAPEAEKAERKWTEKIG
jgi:hypothetical protein